MFSDKAAIVFNIFSHILQYMKSSQSKKYQLFLPTLVQILLLNMTSKITSCVITQNINFEDIILKLFVTNTLSNKNKTKQIVVVYK